MALTLLTLIAGNAWAQGPAFSCKGVADDSIEALICADEELSALDRRMAQVFMSASNRAVTDRPQILKPEQRGWIKGRNDCWKSDDERACVAEAYRNRIVVLQARYRLVPFTGPVTYICNADARDEISVNFFQTEPPTLIAERGDQGSLMFRQPSASGTLYEGPNESFWEHQGEARVTWGFEAEPMTCTRAAP